MERRIIISIQAGSKHCDKCPHIRGSDVGSNYVCDIFGEQLYWDESEVDTLRSRQCRDAETDQPARGDE